MAAIKRLAFILKVTYFYVGARQKRTFDLTNNGIGSRYLLFKRFLNGIYQSEVVFGANILTLECKVENDIHGDAALMFDYKRKGWTVDVGYNVWGISKDKITITQDIPVGVYGAQGLTLTSAPTGKQNAELNHDQRNVLARTENSSREPSRTIASNPDSAANPGAFTNKFFTHVGDTWENCDYLPFLGMGGEVEFSGSNGRAWDQWGIWIKCGFTFV